MIKSTCAEVQSCSRQVQSIPRPSANASINVPERVARWPLAYDPWCYPAHCDFHVYPMYSKAHQSQYISVLVLPTWLQVAPDLRLPTRLAYLPCYCPSVYVRSFGLLRTSLWKVQVRYNAVIACKRPEKDLGFICRQRQSLFTECHRRQNGLSALLVHCSHSFLIQDSVLKRHCQYQTLWNTAWVFWKSDREGALIKTVNECTKVL